MGYPLNESCARRETKRFAFVDELVAVVVLPTSMSAIVKATPDFLIATAPAGTTSNVLISFDGDGVADGEADGEADGVADGEAEGVAEGVGLLVALTTGFFAAGFLATGFLVIFFLTTGLVAPSARSPKISEPIKPLVMVMKRRRDGRLAGLAGLAGLI